MQLRQIEAELSTWFKTQKRQREERLQAISLAAFNTDTGAVQEWSRMIEAQCKTRAE